MPAFVRFCPLLSVRRAFFAPSAWADAADAADAVDVVDGRAGGALPFQW